jgi:hypothetical protein
MESRFLKGFFAVALSVTLMTIPASAPKKNKGFGCAAVQHDDDDLPLATPVLTRQVGAWKTPYMSWGQRFQHWFDNFKARRRQ